MRLGEADRIITVLCRSRGKVRAVAKGVRKTTSRFGGRLEPLSHVSLLCWQGRELDIVNQAEVLDSFRAVREDFNRVSKAYAMLEVADRVSVERHATPALYDLMVRALGYLADDDSAMLVPAFFMKVLVVDGTTPLLEACASCGTDEDLMAFDLLEGGVLCRNCRRGRAVTPAAITALRGMLDGGLARVLTEPAGPLATEVTELMTEAMETHLDRQIRSVRTAPGV
jgi:DNA repair protein RecO (recombination protein O)